jgi:selenide,water dikinase
VGHQTGDDAAVIRLTDELAMVQSTDFFLPIVDDPFDFGRIAAANAISDIYAMGAVPVMALAILGWPRSKLPMEAAGRVMAGGAEVCREAGIRIVGGHSIDDAEPKFGLVVSGTAHPDRVLRNSTGRAGDVLVLTKPLGSGALAQGVKKGAVEGQMADDLVATMVHLNRGASEAAHEVGVHAATDVTGFSLLGHTLEMADGAGLGAELWLDSIPVLPGARELIAQGIHPGATSRNLGHFQDRIEWAPRLDAHAPQLLADPQTSGGLLLAVPPEREETLISELRARGCLAYAGVGRLVEGEGLRVLARR